LTAAQGVVATQMGMTGPQRKIYARLLKKQPASVEVQ